MYIFTYIYRKIGRHFIICVFILFIVESQESRFKRNISLYDKLQVISNKRSRYAIKTQTSPPHDPLLHHNYLYECHRRYKNIDKNNSIIASKILKVKGDIDRKKQEADFKVNKFNVSRLEKFQRFKRLNRVVSKSVSQKFNTSGSRITPRTPIIRINLANTIPNPETS